MIQNGSTGIIIGGEIAHSQLIGGQQYTAEEWNQKLRDDQTSRIEAKLDAIIAYLKIQIPSPS